MWVSEDLIKKMLALGWIAGKRPEGEQIVERMGNGSQEEEYWADKV